MQDCKAWYLSLVMEQHEPVFYHWFAEPSRYDTASHVKYLALQLYKSRITRQRFLK